MLSNTKTINLTSGQTWIAKKIMGNDADQIEITGTNEHVVFIKTQKGIRLSSDEAFIKLNYRLDASSDLNGEIQ